LSDGVPLFGSAVPAANAAFVGVAAALFASSSWAVSTVLVKGSILRYGPRAFNLFRCTVALALFWIASVAVEGAHSLHAMTTRDGVTLLLSGVLGLAIGDVFLFEAVRRLGAQPAVAMNQLSPVWSALLGLVLGLERLALVQYLGVATVIAGVLLVIFGRVPAAAPGGIAGVAHDASGWSIGFLVGLLSSLCNASAGMMTRHAIHGVGELAGSTLRMTGGAVALFGASVVTRRLRVETGPLRALQSMRKELVAIFLATFLGILLQQSAYARLDASVALCLLSTTPIFLLPLAVGILRERYRPRAWLGTLLATAGVPLLLAQGAAQDAGQDATRDGTQDGESSMQALFARNVVDPHSYSRPAEATVRHLDLDLVVDFARKELSGRASLQIEAAKDAQRLVLDARDLSIERVTTSAQKPPSSAAAASKGGAETEVKFELGAPQPDLGSALTIPIAASLARGERWVNVTYRTSPGAAALQWLAPEQTAGGRRPFLFTQSQAILARTWIPCQDTPSVRMTYDARIRVNRIGPVGDGPPLLALMSAENPQQRSADGVYTFKMPQPIPSYLMALAVGDLEFRSLGPRSGVYAEPSVVGGAASEFVDLEKMIGAAESLYGPYRWGRYDVIVLPPSFPFGGMENPRLTFATPTILAGDRSLVSLVAHELAHSWSGNLVTNATWNDFWLNEGFTVYFEHRIMQAVFGQEFDDALAVLGLQDLEKTIAELRDSKQEGDTALKLKLDGRNPDDGVTDVAYEKGARFLQVIEKTVGRARFDAFLRKWFDGNAFQSRTTEDFLLYLQEEFADAYGGSAKLGDAIQVDAWVYRPGLPSNCPRATSTALAKAEAEVAKFVAGAAPASLDTKNFSTQQWQCFLRKLPADLPNARMAELDRAFGLSDRGNSEVLFAWLLQCVQHRFEPAFPSLERFLTSQGRRKFLKPLYQELAKTDWGKQLARKIYEKARPTYHAVSRDTIDDILKWGT
jgi:drug/metabolite transporter (DMT)-like permease